MDKQTINQVLSTKFEGKNYSQRIWTNTDILANQLKDKLAVAIATGQGIEKTSREFRERFGVSNIMQIVLLELEQTISIM